MIEKHLSLVTAPTGDVVTVDEVKTQLGITGTASDAALALDLASATAFFDGREGLLGRALRPQTWDYSLSRFPWREIEIPLPPLISVTSVSYLDVDGVAQTVDPSVYLVLGIGGRGILSPLVPPWPTTSMRANAVTVRFQSGYPDTVGPSPKTTVPEPIRKAIVLKVAQLRSMSRSDALLKQDSVIGVSSQVWETSADASGGYDKAIRSLVARYMEFTA